MAEAFAWSPWIAVAVGAAAAGLGALRSLAWAFGLAVAALFAQVVAWMVLLTLGATEETGRPADWNAALAAAFLLGLTVVTPYTTIGAVAGGMLGRLVRLVTRKPRDTKGGRGPFLR